MTIAGGGALGLVLPMRLGPGILGLLASQAVLGAVSALVASALWAWFRWRSWKEQGWPGLKPGATAFARGLSGGVAMAALVIVAEISLGVARLSLTDESGASFAGSAVPILAVLAVAALGEELLFRGFPLSRLASATGPVAAAVILATGFTAMHYTNPGVNALALANVGLASLVLSAAFLGWGGLPAAWGVHLGWNAGLALGADAPVSGITFGVPMLDFTTSGPDWVSGGAFGPEGGVVASLVMISVTLVLGRRLLAFPSPHRGEGTGARV